MQNLLFQNSKISRLHYIETRDCETERKNAMIQHQQDPDGKTYIPRCTALGKWAKAQCHDSSQYCWCVDEETGTPIQGTSTHKVQPQCDQIVDREMKGGNSYLVCVVCVTLVCGRGDGHAHPGDLHTQGPTSVWPDRRQGDERWE